MTGKGYTEPMRSVKIEEAAKGDEATAGERTGGLCK